jgi:hypothetical protein
MRKNTGVTGVQEENNFGGPNFVLSFYRLFCDSCDSWTPGFFLNPERNARAARPAFLPASSSDRASTPWMLHYES